MTSALKMGMGLAAPSGRFTPGKTRHPLYSRLGGPQGRSGRVRKISPPTGIRSPDRPARSKSLYRLNYRGRRIMTLNAVNYFRPPCCSVLNWNTQVLLFEDLLSHKTLDLCGWWYLYLRYWYSCWYETRGGTRYKPEGRGFDSRWCHRNFSLT